MTQSPVPFSSSGPFWEARLKGLAENTTYYYQIGAGPENTFKTPVSRGSAGFTVVAQGDIGETGSYPNMGLVQDRVAAPTPTFVLMVGDLTYANGTTIAAVDQHFNDVMGWSARAAYMPGVGQP